jgi:hypothetical protein
VPKARPAESPASGPQVPAIGAAAGGRRAAKIGPLLRSPFTAGVACRRLRAMSLLHAGEVIGLLGAAGRQSRSRACAHARTARVAGAGSVKARRPDPFRRRKQRAPKSKSCARLRPRARIQPSRALALVAEHAVHLTAGPRRTRDDRIEATLAPGRR